MCVRARACVCVRACVRVCVCVLGLGRGAVNAVNLGMPVTA